MSPRLKPDERRTAELTARLGLGEEHGRTYAWLYGGYVHMRGLFNEFIEGFGPGMGLEPAHRWASRFIDRVQTFYIEEITLSICRLTDPEETGGDPKKRTKPEQRKRRGHPNRSLALIPLMFGDDDDLRKELEDLVKQAKEKATVLRDLRNKWIAHSARDESKIKGIPLGMIEAAMDAIHGPFALVSERKLNESMNIKEWKGENFPVARPTNGPAALGSTLDRMETATLELAGWLRRQIGASPDHLEASDGAARMLEQFGKKSDRPDDTEAVIEYFQLAAEITAVRRNYYGRDPE